MLLEREEPLRALADYAVQARDGHGRVVFVSGEAGVGKTSLIRAFLTGQESSHPGVRIRRGACDSLLSAEPFGPVAEAFPEWAGTLEALDPGQRMRVFRSLLDTDEGGPALLVLEDVHWADDPTLDFLRFLVRRIGERPLLTVASLRDDETGSGLSALLGDSASLPDVERLQLLPLTDAGVAELIRDRGSTLDAEDLSATTGGNPFFVTEVIESGSLEPPASVRDAVLARTQRSSPGAQATLSAAAVAGSTVDLPLLVTLPGASAAGADECVARGLLVPLAQSRVSFRHEIAREAVEQAIPPGAKLALHEELLACLLAAPAPDQRRIVHHAHEAGHSGIVLAHAPAAAERASAAGAHRAAAVMLRLAIEHAERSGWPDQPGGGPRELADLHDRLAYECYLIDAHTEALESRVASRALYVRLSDAHGVGVTERWMSRLSWFLGNGAQAREHGARAVEILEREGPSAELAMAYSNRSQLSMLAGDTDSAITWGRRAVQLAQETGAAEVEVHAMINIGTSQMIDGDTKTGVARLQHSLDVSVAAGLHEHAARAYTNLGTQLVSSHRLPEGERVLRAGISYCTERDLDSWRLYMSAWLARALAESGSLANAMDVACSVLGRVGVAAPTRIPALAAWIQAATRTGIPVPQERLDEAVALAEESGEAQRIIPVATAAAELAWTIGDRTAMGRHLEASRRLDDRSRTAPERAELAWWRHLCGSKIETRGVEGAFVEMADGRWVEAAQQWEQCGAVFYQALSLGFSPDLEDARTAMALLDKMGAHATRSAISRERMEAGLPVPRPARQRTRDNPYGLTARELEVLGLVALDRTNAQIAEALFLSEKTVEHHVSAVLRKLGERSRAGAAATALRQGLA
jgi:ATP/maltotriose-dependent transcriptional regulator MalT